MTMRIMKTKKCSHKGHKGKRELEINKFSPHPNTKDKKQSICKECNKRLALRRARKISLKKKKQKGKDPKFDYKEKKLDYNELVVDILDVEDIPDDILICDL